VLKATEPKPTGTLPGITPKMASTRTVLLYSVALAGSGLNFGVWLAKTPAWDKRISAHDAARITAW